jgi:hypothetical protein
MLLVGPVQRPLGRQLELAQPAQADLRQPHVEVAANQLATMARIHNANANCNWRGQSRRIPNGMAD